LGKWTFGNLEFRDGEGVEGRGQGEGARGGEPLERKRGTPGCARGGERAPFSAAARVPRGAGRRKDEAALGRRHGGAGASKETHRERLYPRKGRRSGGQARPRFTASRS
jgi:hypothetical protein